MGILETILPIFRQNAYAQGQSGGKSLWLHLGFSGIDYTVGPYFVPSRKGELQGVQIDLVFDRPDNVMTACEIKYGSRPVGVEVIPEMERKVQLLEAVAGRKTIHKVLIVKEPVSQELARRMYFYRIIRADELFQ